MKKLLLFLVLTFSCTLMVKSRAPANLYSSSTGSDTANNCTNSAAPCNLANGFANEMAQVVAGNADILYMCAGACNGSGSASVPVDFDDSTTVPVGTSWANALTVTTYPGETVTIRKIWLGQFSARPPIQYVIFKGATSAREFKVDCDDGGLEGDGHFCASFGGATDMGDSHPMGTPTTHHIRLQDMELMNNPLGANIVGVHFAADLEFLNLNVHHGGNDIRDHCLYISNKTDRVLVEGGEYHDCWSAGIQIYSQPANGPYASEITVKGVRLYNNSVGIIAGADNSLYSNNLIYLNNGQGAGPGQTPQGFGGPGISTGWGGNGQRHYNNTIYGHTGGYGCIVSQFSFHDDARNNICWGNTPNTIASDIETRLNNLFVDPLFTNQAGNDFTLTDLSPALNTCGTLAAVPDDFLGVLRPQGSAYDCGAYEKTDIIGGGGSGNTRTPAVTENCTGAAAALSTGYTQLSTARTVNRDGSGKCTGSSFGFDTSAVVRSTGTFSAGSQYAAAIVNSLGSTTDGTAYVTVGCFLSADQDGARDGYETYVWNVTGTIHTVAYKWTNGVQAQLPGGGRTDVTWPNGAVLAQECTSGRVVVMKDANVILDLADSSHTTGKPGFGANGDALIDDIEMGDLNVTPGTCTINVQQPAAGSINSRPNTTGIFWTTQNCTGNVDLQASWNGGTTWLPKFATVAFNSSPYTWDTVIGESATVKVRVCSGADCGASEAFTVHGEFVK